MARTTLTKTLFVSTNGKAIGKLIKHANQQLSFEYNKNWLLKKDAWPISLSMPLSKTRYEGRLVTAFFDNLLPDSDSIKARIQRRFNAASTSGFDLLSHIGKDCVGALQLCKTPQIDYRETITGQPVTKPKIAKLLQGYRNAPLGMQADSDFRISIAGAQEKTALLWHEKHWKIPLGSTPTTHIIKLPIGIIEHSGLNLEDSVENEWLCLKLLAEFGIPVATANMQTFSKIKTLVVERFDRKWNQTKTSLLRLPQEDFCQILGVSSNLKYESDGGPGIAQIMTVLAGANHATEARYLFMKTVFLFWMLGAIDGHAKNFSIRILPQGQFQLTPIYDVMSAYPLLAKKQLEKQKLKMAMAVTEKNRHFNWYNIQARHWLTTAKLCQFPQSSMLEIIEQSCTQLEAVLTKVESILPTHFPSYMFDAIKKGMREIKNRCVPY